jgi:predicted nucleotidyltransferase
MESELDLTDVPGEPVLVGVGGSHAYGLAHADSDVDYRGCYVAPSKAFFALTSPAETYTRNEPDVSLHEIGKFLRLAAGANPTILETFFYDTYIVRTSVGDLLIQNRDLFITSRIKDTHLGYARSQFKRLEQRKNSFSADTAKRTEKHARHMLRLVRQAEGALKTGEYKIQVEDPEEMFAFGRLSHDEMVEKFEREFDRIKDTVSVLPPAADLDKINDLLIDIRLAAFDR